MATVAAADPAASGSISIFFAGADFSDLVLVVTGASAFSDFSTSSLASFTSSVLSEAMRRGTCMMPLNAGEKAEEGMIPWPVFVRLILVFFTDEDDEDCGGAKLETPLARARNDTSGVLNFMLI